MLNYYHRYRLFCAKEEKNPNNINIISLLDISEYENDNHRIYQCGIKEYLSSCSVDDEYLHSLCIYYDKSSKKMNLIGTLYNFIYTIYENKNNQIEGIVMVLSYLINNNYQQHYQLAKNHLVSDTSTHELIRLDIWNKNNNIKLYTYIDNMVQKFILAAEYTSKILLKSKNNRHDRQNILEIIAQIKHLTKKDIIYNTDVIIPVHNHKYKYDILDIHNYNADNDTRYKLYIYDLYRIYEKYIFIDYYNNQIQLTPNDIKNLILENKNQSKIVNNNNKINPFFVLACIGYLKMIFIYKNKNNKYTGDKIIPPKDNQQNNNRKKKLNNDFYSVPVF